MEVSAFSIGMRFVGTEEVKGAASNPMILAMLRLDQKWPESDAVPWCSAWLNYVAWLLRLPRSKSLAARSWLGVGTPIRLEDAIPENDVVILKRGKSPTAGHVGFYAGLEGNRVLLLGGNQSDSVNVSSFPVSDVLGVRRLA